ncbi:uncharacterized protein EV420DRAFT_1644611 [Desarmillaria tabescens]|uniref:Uncharacterized protein n=1 Tax=Armillaria tabescens TaxID=1929756 RepID=A0AA39N319_ARMTA|nr:uncharacterized protein EV420DRAFT_1644611 [Desarmillaria tabescens]KAK0455375.1 hypothetical protein EV420DRAFT_1644611 [Desarmillaria tabescens]
MLRYTQPKSSIPWLNQIISVLEHNNVTIFDVLVQVLRFGHVAQNLHAYRANLWEGAGEIADLLLEQEEDVIRNWVAAVTVHTYQTEILHLIEGQQGFHFQANHATLEQLECFDLAELGTKMKGIAPLTWQMLAALLNSDNRRHWEVNEEDNEDTSSDSTMSDSDDEFIWDDLDLQELDVWDIPREASDENDTLSVISMELDQPDIQWESSSQFSMDVDLETVVPHLNVAAGDSTDDEQPKRRRRRRQDLPK